jgi:hypothetical protein
LTGNFSWWLVVKIGAIAISEMSRKFCDSMLWTFWQGDRDEIALHNFLRSSGNSIDLIAIANDT